MICYEEYPKNEFFNLPSCHHKYCILCTREHIKQQILNAKVLKLKCCNHDCEEPFSEYDVKKILSGTKEKENDILYIKYLKFKQIKLLD
jgi:hypothetical protein